MRRGDRLNAVRRRVEERIDQAYAMATWRLRPAARVPPYDGDPRVALVAVNRSTTRFLKLMLLTLSEQDDLGVLRRAVLVDNASRDGGGVFVDRLASRSPSVVAVHNRHLLNHARGVRSGLAALRRAERDVPDAERTNLVLFCDSDVVFRRADALVSMVSVLTVEDGALAGELRRTTRTYPDAQASFLLVRRDWMARPGVRPWVNHGSPSLWLQESLWRSGATIVDFPSNHGGFVLHRGRSAVAATRDHAPRSSYATAPMTPSYMGVPDGAAIWSAIEARWAEWLVPAREDELVQRLARRFTNR